MKYRIASFKQPEDKTGNMFFVQVGKPFKEKLFWIFYTTKTNWQSDEGFRTNDEALQRIEEIKNSMPVYTEIL